MLISDVYTDTVRRKKMADKRSRKMATVLEHLPAPTLEGPVDAEVTLVGWGSTWGVLTEAVEQLNRRGHLDEPSADQVPGALPRHRGLAILGKSRRVIVVENNQSGQFARHLRAETGISAHGHIRKYDGEPFEPKHIVAAVKEILANGTEVIEVLSTERGWQTEHPTGTSRRLGGTTASCDVRPRRCTQPLNRPWRSDTWRLQPRSL